MYNNTIPPVSFLGGFCMQSPKSKKAIETKNKLIKAAKKLFYESDINKTSVREIVEEAGVAKGTFYLYFETKEDIVWAVLNETVVKATALFQQLENTDGSMDMIDYMIDEIMLFVSQNIDELKIVHQSKFLGYLGTSEIENKYVDIWYLPIKNWLEKGVQMGIYNISDPEFYAKYAYSSIHEMIDRMITGKEDYDIDTLGEKIKEIIKKILL